MELIGEPKYLFVSRYYFRLTTEAVRLQSNLLMQHTTLSQLASGRAGRACELVDRYDSADLIEHLRIIPSAGDVKCDLAISDACIRSLEAAGPSLGNYLERTILLVDVLSLVLFDLVVEANATEVLTKLGLTSAEAGNYRVILKNKPGSVVPKR